MWTMGADNGSGRGHLVDLIGHQHQSLLGCKLEDLAHLRLAHTLPRRIPRVDDHERAALDAALLRLRVRPLDVCELDVPHARVEVLGERIEGLGPVEQCREGRVEWVDWARCEDRVALCVQEPWCASQRSNLGQHHVGANTNSPHIRSRVCR